MPSHGQSQEAIMSSFDGAEGVPGERKEGNSTEDSSKFSVKSLLWHGGSVHDAWFSCASNQVRSRFQESRSNTTMPFDLWVKVKTSRDMT